MLDYILCAVVRALGVILRSLPFGLALYLGRRGGDLAYILAGKKRKARAYADMKAALGDRLTPAQLRLTLRRLFWNLGEGFVELLWFPRIDDEFFRKHIKIQNMDYLVEARKRPVGLIFLTAHFGNWEMLNLAAAMKGYPIKAVARTQKMKRLNELLNRYRRMKGCQVIFKDEAKREILKALKGKEIVGILSDQSGGARGVFVDFFGRPAPAPAGAIALSLKTDAIILPVFMVKERPGYHRVEINEPLNLQKTGGDADVKDGLREYLRLLEGYIAKYPDHWLWLHRRWKATSSRRIAILNDGRAGHLNQSLAVAGELEATYRGKKVYDEHLTVQKRVIDVKYKSKFHRAVVTVCGAFSSSSCQGCMRCLKFALTPESYDALVKSYADVVISAGSYLAPVSIVFSKETCARNIMIMKPSAFGTGRFDLVIAPRHDGLKAKRNVVVTRLSPGNFDATLLRNAALELKGELGLDDKRRIGFFVGGDADSYSLPAGVVKKTALRLREISSRDNGEILATTSRRTSPEIERILEETLSGAAGVKLLVIANRKNKPNVACAMLGLCDVAVISVDSFSMISEALNANVPVVAFGDIASSCKQARVARCLSQEGLIELAQPDELELKIESAINKRKELESGGAKDRALIRQGLERLIKG